MQRRTLILGTAGLAAATSSLAEGQQVSVNQASVPTTGEARSLPADLGTTKLELPTKLALKSSPNDQWIDRGLEALKRDSDAWQQTVRQFDSLYGPLPQGPLNSKDQSTPPRSGDLRQLRSTLVYDAALSGLFSSNHVEILLNQTADLLERASTSAEALKDKSAKAASLALEVATFFQNDKIHQDEIKEGIYTTPYQVSLAEERSLQRRADGYSTSAFWLSLIKRDYLTLERINYYCGRQQLLAWLSYIPSHQYPGVGDALQNSWNGIAKSSADHALSATADLGFKGAFIDLYTTEAQIAAQQTGYEVTAATLNAATAKRQWDQADIEFKRRRTQAARDIADEKVRLASIPGGSLNYAEQAGTHKSRLIRDLLDALSRLRACEQGLKTIYGRSTPLPKSAALLILSGKAENALLIEMLEETLEWTRNSIAYLVAFGHRDQSYTRTFSLRQIIGLDAWKTGRRDGVWRFQINAAMFPEQYCIRVRGLNLFVTGSSELWQATIRAPTVSFYADSGGGSRRVVQADMPAVRLGKVGKRSDQRYQEVYGTSSIRNAAPFGEWEIRMPEKALSGEGRSDIADLELDLELVVRARG